MNLRTIPHHKFHLRKQRIDHALASEILRHDPVFHHIPLSAVPKLTSCALERGEEVADAVYKKYGTRDPLRLARHMDIRILFDITYSPSRALTVLSRYHEKPPTIIIYESAIRQCRDNMARWEIKQKTFLSELTQICAAHEIYHHIERTTFDFIDLTYCVPIINLGFLKIEKSVRSLSEIAAHAFAKSYLRLPFLPCCLDAQLFEQIHQEEME